MKLIKQKDGDSYKLSFEFTRKEMKAIGLGLEAEFDATWKSKSQTDYADWIKKFLLYERLFGQTRTGFGSFKFDFNNFFSRQTQNSQYHQQAYQGYSAYQGFTGTQQKTEPTWCKVLGLKQSATKDEIKKKYRELAKKHHPDAGGDPKKFTQIQSAYEEAI